MCPDVSPALSPPSQVMLMGLVLNAFILKVISSSWYRSAGGVCLLCLSRFDLVLSGISLGKAQHPLPADGLLPKSPAPKVDSMCRHTLQWGEGREDLDTGSPVSVLLRDP